MTGTGTVYTVFLDRREATESRALLEDRFFVSKMLGRSDAYQTKSGADAADFLVALRRIDWHHPVLVVYREDGYDRWSYVTLGLNSPEGGEDE